MSQSTVMKYNTMQSIAHGSIGATFSPLGTQITHSIRLYKIVNNTDGDMIFSTDGINDQDIVPAATASIYDVTSNRGNNAPFIVLPALTQLYVRYSTAPTKNSVYFVTFSGNQD
jgi:hypothetical protein